jgi:hypothetical protein
MNPGRGGGHLRGSGGVSGGKDIGENEMKVGSSGGGGGVGGGGGIGGRSKRRSSKKEWTPLDLTPLTRK